MLNGHKIEKFILITNGGLQLDLAKMWGAENEERIFRTNEECVHQIGMHRKSGEIVNLSY